MYQQMLNSMQNDYMKQSWRGGTISTDNVLFPKGHIKVQRGRISHVCHPQIYLKQQMSSTVCVMTREDARRSWVVVSEINGCVPMYPSPTDSHLG